MSSDFRSAIILNSVTNRLYEDELELDIVKDSSYVWTKDLLREAMDDDDLIGMYNVLHGYIAGVTVSDLLQGSKYRSEAQQVLDAGCSATEAMRQLDEIVARIEVESSSLIDTRQTTIDTTDKQTQTDTSLVLTQRHSTNTFTHTSEKID